jgi:hypothetical protein
MHLRFIQRSRQKKVWGLEEILRNHLNIWWLFIIKSRTNSVFV